MDDLIRKISNQILYAIQDVMDEYEDRQFGETEVTLMGNLIHRFEIDGKKFFVAIKRSE